MSLLTDRCYLVDGAAGDISAAIAQANADAGGRVALLDIDLAGAQRQAQSIDAGSCIAFLLSDDALIIRGQAINVDGGDTPY